jgi:polyvinyl alcohol dehydrogenase (cytochrome)
VFGISAALVGILILLGGAWPVWAEDATPPATAASKGPKSLEPDDTNAPGRQLFETHCLMCHNGSVERAPHRLFLRMMAPDAILNALENGIMKGPGASLTHTQRRQVAEYLTGKSLAHYRPDPGAVLCKGAALTFDTTKPPAQVGWGYDPRRFIPADVAGLAAADVTRLKLKWSYAFPNALRARSQPVVAMNTIFVGSQDGTVYAFDIDTGCARWTSKVSAEVRTAIVVEPWPAGTKPAHPPRLFFGDLLGRVHAADALTGKLLWTTRPDVHPNATITGTPLLHGDTLYVPVSSLENALPADPTYACCTFRGSVVALDSATGQIKWQHYTIPEPAKEQFKSAAGIPTLAPSGGGVWSSPAFDETRGVIYHGSGQNYTPPAEGNSDAVFAVDAKTGKRRWVRQLESGDFWNAACVLGGPACPAPFGPDHDVASSPLLIDLGGGRQILVVAAKSGMVHGLDPDDGHIVWRRRLGRGSIFGGVHFGMAAEGTRVYVPIFDSAAGPDGKPITTKGFPGLYALDAAHGDLIWSAPSPDRCDGRPLCEPGITAVVTAIPGVVFAGQQDGWLRAYDSASGKVIWEDDTTIPVKAVNGAMARGGSMSGPGVAVASGHVIVNSGYAFIRHAPGNALRVYTVDGK